MKKEGLTLVEVLVALVLIGIVVSFFTTSFVSNIQQSNRFGQRTQASQYLNYFGRRVAGGDNTLLPTSGAPLAWNYGALSASFPDLNNAGFADPNQYRVSIVNGGTVTLAGASAVRYTLTVCHKPGQNESCVIATTTGSAPAAGQNTPPLPGIN